MFFPVSLFWKLCETSFIIFLCFLLSNLEAAEENTELKPRKRACSSDLEIRGDVSEKRLKNTAEEKCEHVEEKSLSLKVIN